MLTLPKDAFDIALATIDLIAPTYPAVDHPLPEIADCRRAQAQFVSPQNKISYLVGKLSFLGHPKQTVNLSWQTAKSFVVPYEGERLGLHQKREGKRVHKGTPPVTLLLDADASHLAKEGALISLPLSLGSNLVLKRPAPFDNRVREGKTPEAARDEVSGEPLLIRGGEAGTRLPHPLQVSNRAC